MKQYLFTIVFLFGSLSSLLAQFDKNYQPLMFEGEIPEHFSTYLKGNLTETNPLRNEADAYSQKPSSFHTLSQHALSQAMRSGSIYLNPEVNEYLNRLVDYLLKDQADLRAQIHVYGTKILIPNASCWADGTLFVNLSLLPYLDNEAQLAYILCHEIAHFQLKHSLRAFQKEEELRNQMSTDSDKLFDYLRFSREHELEADLAGLELFLTTSYSPSEALIALQQLEIVNQQSQYHPLNLDSLFVLPMMPIDSAYNCRPVVEEEEEPFVGIRKLSLDKFQEKIERKMDAQEKEKKEEEEKEDLPSTHPSIEERIEALKKVLPEELDSTSYNPFVFPKEDFLKLRVISIFEYTDKVFHKGYYFSSLYQSLRMAESFPENQYLQEIAAQSLYWIAFYIRRRQLDDILPEAEVDPIAGYDQFICSMNNMSKSTLRKLSTTFLEDRAERFPQSGPILISLAKTYDILSKKELAQGTFLLYLERFPEGSHAPYAKLKTKNLN